MSNRILLALLFLGSTVIVFAQQRDRKLEGKLAEIMQGFHGDAGVCVKSLRTGKVASVNGDSLFPTASMIKVSLLIGVMRKIENGELQYHQEMMYRDSLLYAGVDLLGSFKDSQKIELSKLLMLMCSMSDNTASLWLQGMAGGGLRINQLLDSLGLVSTRVNSRTPGREANRQRYGWGQTTPDEMVSLFEKIYRGEVVSRNACDRMLRLLGRNYWDEAALSQIPPYIFVACKHGCVDECRGESMLVMAPHGPYLLSVITKNQRDTSWNQDNEGWVLARKISRFLWNYFEPKSGWKPTVNLEGKLE
jgi:beta-lactamase class A